MTTDSSKQIAVINRPSVDQIFESLDVSKETLKDYKYRIDLFIQFTNEHGFTYNTFIEFKRHLASNQKLSVSTKNKFLSVAKIFLKELNRRGILPTDTTHNVKGFKQNRGHQVFGLEKPEIERIIQQIHQLSFTPQNARLIAIFALLVHNGLRQCEVARLDFSDLNFGSGTAMILGKSRDGKEPVYLSPDTVRILKRYISTCKNREGALFKSLGNRHSQRLTTKTVNRDMKKLFELAGVDKTIHGLRHFFTTNLLNHFDIRTVRKFTRHKSIETVLIYDDELELGEKAQEVFKFLPKIQIKK
jgi:integrase/recombinase XerC